MATREHRQPCLGHNRWVDYTDGRLMFRAPQATGEERRVRREPEAGDFPLGIEVGRDGVLYIPDNAGSNATVVVFLHGAGGTGRRELRAVIAAADRFGVVIAAPDSRGMSWDVLEGGFGPDVAFMDRMLRSLDNRFDLDLTHLAIGGISDGASYALSLGVVNGDLFHAVLAFSPGFAVAPAVIGRPRIFVSHGTEDPILPIDATSRPLVSGLRSEGYDVTYREFTGGHTVPPPIADAGFAWLVGATSG
jgi:phospholipase/carboxylesterase